MAKKIISGNQVVNLENRHVQTSIRMTQKIYDRIVLENKIQNKNGEKYTISDTINGLLLLTLNS